jgi:plastocyanin
LEIKHPGRRPTLDINPTSRQGVIYSYPEPFRIGALFNTQHICVAAEVAAKFTHPRIPSCRIAGVDMTSNQQLGRRLLVGAGSLLIATGTLAGCGPSAESAATTPSSMAAAPAGPVIDLSSLMFQPAETTVQVGTTVTWRNDEPITHTVTSGSFRGVDKTTGLRSSQKPDGRFETKLTGNGKTFSFTFTQPGTYTYYCDIHQGMNATITVIADDTSPEGKQK